MYHNKCKKKFKAYNTWFLYNIANFENRELKLGVCPKCSTHIGELIEQRKEDGKIFSQMFTGNKLLKVIAIEKHRINYTALDSINKNKSLFGWVYGINKEDKKGTFRQYSADFFGNKKLVKKYKNCTQQL